MQVLPIPSPRRDPVFASALIVLALASFTSFLPLSLANPHRFALIGRAIAAAAALIAVLARPGEEPKRTRGFWRLIAAGLGFFFAAQIWQAAAAGALVAAVARREELLYLGRYLFIVMALELRPDREQAGRSEEQLQTLDNAGAVLFLFSLIAYVLLSPGEGEVAARSPLRVLYIVLDVFLVMRAFTIRLHSASAYWRAVYAWLGCALALRALNNLFVSPPVLGAMEPVGADPMTGPFWYLLFLPLILAARVPHDSKGDVVVAAPTRSQGRLAPLVAYAFAFPIFHFALERLGVVEAETAGPREMVVLGFLVVSALMLWVYQRVLIRDNRRLEHERQLIAEQAAEARRMEGLGRLAGGVAHDFNNLLTVIRGRTELMLAEQGPHSPLTEDLDAIRQATRRGEGVTRQLLAFGRRQILRPEVLDLGSVVTELAPLLQSAVSEEVRVSVQVEDVAPLIVADQGQVEMALLNLAVNAREAMPGGGLLALSVARVDLDELAAAGIRDAQPGSYVLLMVRDTGRGMDEATLERIFEPFFTTKPFGSGAGLGLPAVHGFVRQSGGAIVVDSAPGRGAEFKIYLPRVEAAAAFDGNGGRA